MAQVTDVEPREIIAAAAELDSIIQTMQGCVTQIVNQVQDLNTNWSGDVKTEFMRQFEGDKTAMDNMIKAYRDVGAMLRTIAREYEQIEQEIKSDLGSLRV